MRVIELQQIDEFKGTWQFLFEDGQVVEVTNDQFGSGYWWRIKKQLDAMGYPTSKEDWPLYRTPLNAAEGTFPEYEYKWSKEGIYDSLC